MRILSKRTLREFWEKHSDSEQQLLSWYKDFKSEEFRSTTELLKRFSKCRSIGLNRYIFNIKGNNYRLIVIISFELQTSWIRFIGTHSEYDKIDPLTI
ncbi:MAG: type II toxin-antitoxin system HigB family toxin [Cyclobacteriaceae bacterium]|nr:type II toxin-antitoxin system HigB family toxin [Cyclobacteriaceae bacterium]MCK5370659.1 type II toxin-antitoxin system HigB family toxin [Cyclobacteriaceae bacterium]MCK5467102.1 type II toxin-antitoxin system HigB family toxin [Cyclobacteriaceae bacterium]